MKRAQPQNQEQESKRLNEASKYLNPKLFDSDFKESLQNSISTAEPYKWGSISQLVDDDLLRSVRNEILQKIHFTKKETDIYKVHQSGDLNNLNGLDSKELSELPNLLKLRDALYCPKFRQFISEVTQAGKISSKKYDMSLNIYHKSCHLLTHDDVIGSRRVSFIMYLPDPDKKWKPHYGGALRLFDTHFANVPKNEYKCKFVPQFNDYAFFEVVPGHSFHDVEEVKVDRQRISIQGWFHIPQEGEEGYIPGELEKYEQQSSLQSLESKEVQQFDYPKLVRDKIAKDDFGLLKDFTDEDIEYLSKFVNKKVLDKENLQKMQEQFLEESLITIDEFLESSLAAELKKLIKHTELSTQVPQMSKDVKMPWKVAMPCVKRRFLYIDGKKLDEDLRSLEYEKRNETVTEEPEVSSGPESPDFKAISTRNETEAKLCEIADFFQSIVFKKFLHKLSTLFPVSEQILIRRFRQGSDFTLATNQDVTSEDKLFLDLCGDNLEKVDALLEATLCLIPSKGWESGENGGYELCMAMDENDDPAIYRKEADNSVLMNLPAKWNQLSLILRDESILKFVKYVSFCAEGSRWDISGQWDVLGEKEDDDEEEDED